MSCRRADGQAVEYLGEHALLLVARELPTCYSLPRWSLLNARPAIAANKGGPLACGSSSHATGSVASAAPGL